MEIEYLTQKEFNDLLEYSTSIPTGTTIGKKWKRKIIHFTLGNQKMCAPGFLPQNIKEDYEEWLTGEYIEVKNPQKVGIRWKKIEIVGSIEVDKPIRKFEERNLNGK